MKKLLALAAVTMLAVGTPTAFQEARAQQVPAAAPAIPDYTAEDAQAVLNARLAALKAVIALTPPQEPLWAPVETALREIVRDAANRRAQRFAAAPPSHFLDVLSAIANAEETRGRDLRRFVDAAKPLVDSLTEAQRRRVPAFLGMTDHGGPSQSSGQLWLFEEEEG
jgi:predicted lipid-binding transport protein (Tim44 family)